MDDERNKRIEDKLDAVVDKLHEIDKTLVRNTESLEYHILSTQQNEDQIKALRDEIKPLANHVVVINWAVKAIVLIATVAGFIKLFL